MNGVVIYEGPSMLDGASVVAIATGLSRASTNQKTGGVMVQTWILRADLDPISASRAGMDASVCGHCPHRWSSGGACYVVLPFAPRSIFAAYKRGIYPKADQGALSALFADRTIRLGAYGDPAAVPLAIWDAVCAEASAVVGYTHQWRSASASGLGRWCMASCDSAQDYWAARAAGWRTFRVRAAGEHLLPGEFVCPASAEGGHRVTCARCRACGGTSRARNGCPTIIVHGALVGRFRAAA